MNWKENFQKGKELVLATSSKDGKPNANIVISLGLVDEKLLLADCQMFTTINNLKENPRICVISNYLRLKGTIEIFSEGEYFDRCIKDGSEYSPKNALLITIEEVFDLDKCEKIEI